MMNDAIRFAHVCAPYTYVYPSPCHACWVPGAFLLSRLFDSTPEAACCPGWIRDGTCDVKQERWCACVNAMLLISAKIEHRVDVEKRKALADWLIAAKEGRMEKFA